MAREKLDYSSSAELEAPESMDVPGEDVGMEAEQVDVRGVSNPEPELEPELEPEDHYVESVSAGVSFGQRILGFIKFLSFIYVMAASSAYLYATYGMPSKEDLEAQAANRVTQEQVLKLDMAIGDVQSDLDGLDLERRFGDVNLSLESGFNGVRSELQGVGGRITRVDQDLAAVTDRVHELDAKVGLFDFASREDLAKVRKALFSLSERVEGLTSVQSEEPVADDEPDAAERVEVEASSGGAVPDVWVDERDSLAGLMVEQFVNYSGKYLMVMGDGVSGSIHVAEGDRLGRYRVVEIDEKSAKVVDMMTNQPIYLVVAS